MVNWYGNASALDVGAPAAGKATLVVDFAYVEVGLSKGEAVTPSANRTTIGEGRVD